MPESDQKFGNSSVDFPSATESIGKESQSGYVNGDIDLNKVKCRMTDREKCQQKSICR